MEFKDTKYGDLTNQTYNGDIDVSRMGLTSLEGAPKIVNGDFNCSWDNLESLKYCPTKVKGNFNCSFNILKSLEYCPTKVGGYFECSWNNLESFNYLPSEIDGNFYYSNTYISQDEIDKLVQVKIKGKIFISKKIKLPSKEDYKLYNKLKDYSKYLKIKRLKDKL